MAIKFDEIIGSVIVDSLVNSLSGSVSFLQVYDGTQPEIAGGTSGSCNLLVQFSGLAWDSASFGSSALLDQKTGTAGTSGTATWARITEDTGIYIIDGNCGTASTCDFVISNNVIAKNQIITLKKASIVFPPGWNDWTGW